MSSTCACETCDVISGVYLHKFMIKSVHQDALEQFCVSATCRKWGRRCCRQNNPVRTLLQNNAKLLSKKDHHTVRTLVRGGQAHIFKHWPAPGEQSLLHSTVNSQIVPAFVTLCAHKVSRTDYPPFVQLCFTRSGVYRHQRSAEDHSSAARQSFCL